MFTKTQEVGRGAYRVTKKVIDWDSVWGAVLFGAIAIVVLVAISQ